MAVTTEFAYLKIEFTSALIIGHIQLKHKAKVCSSKGFVTFHLSSALVECFTLDFTSFNASTSLEKRLV